jgi:hypothetical protein
MKEKDFIIKGRSLQKVYCSDIYQPYGCNKLIITERYLTTKIFSKHVKRYVVLSRLCGQILGNFQWLNYALLKSLVRVFCNPNGCRLNL